eukprot:7370576-Ditylum_brightwellii.AAC.1
MDYRSFIQQCFWLAGSISIDWHLDIVDMGGANGLDDKAGEAAIWCVWAFTIKGLTYAIANILWDLANF